MCVLCGYLEVLPKQQSKENSSKAKTEKRQNPSDLFHTIFKVEMSLQT